MKMLILALALIPAGGCYRGRTQPMNTNQGGGNNTGTATMANDTAATGGTDPFGAGDDGTAPPPQRHPRPLPIEPPPRTPRP